MSEAPLPALHMLRGPLRLRELLRSLMRVDGRQVTSHLLRCAVAVVALFIVVVGSFNLNRVTGLQLFEYLVGANIFAIYALGPILFANVLAEEYEIGEVDLVLMSDLPLTHFVAAKWLSRLISSVMILVIQVPFAMLCVTLGGMHAWQILAVYAWMAVALIVTAALSLLGSSLARRPQFAVAWAIGLVTVYTIVHGRLSFLLRSGATSSMEKVIVELLRFMTYGADPHTNIHAILHREHFAWPAWLLHLVVASGLVMLAQQVFQRTLRQREQQQSRQTKVALQQKRNQRRFPVGPQAIFEKDLRLSGGGWRLIALKCLVLAMLAAAAITMGYRNEGLGHQTTTAVLCAMAAMTLPLAAGRHAGLVFRKEFKQLTWSSLKLLPYSPRELTWRGHASSWALALPELVLALVGALGFVVGSASTSPLPADLWQIFLRAELAVPYTLWCIVLLASQILLPPLSVLSEAQKPFDWEMLFARLRSASAYALYLAFIMGVIVIVAAPQQTSTVRALAVLGMFAIVIPAAYATAMWQCNYWLQRRDND